MKLPKGFGGQGFGGMLEQAKAAMARAQQLEAELASERLEIDKGPVKATFDGTGQLLKLKLDKEVVDPEDIEALEDLIVSAVRDGFTQATENRNERVQSIMPNIPGL
jgi:nucleoid-associated protein EbfC